MNQSFIYLASASPRRRELLDQIGVSYRVHPADLDETRLAGESPRDYVVRLARAKAQAVAATVPAGAAPVLAADTTVVLGDEVLGKPRDRADALAMLKALSGVTHNVLTAVCAVRAAQSHEAVNVTAVSFRDTTAAERERYWQTGEAGDKAGGYSIQGRAAVFVEKITGSYSGVMGLPLFETAQLLGRFGVAVPGPAG